MSETSGERGTRGNGLAAILDSPLFGAIVLALVVALLVLTSVLGVLALDRLRNVEALLRSDTGPTTVFVSNPLPASFWVGGFWVDPQDVAHPDIRTNNNSPDQKPMLFRVKLVLQPGGNVIGEWNSPEVLAGGPGWNEVTGERSAIDLKALRVTPGQYALWAQVYGSYVDQDFKFIGTQKLGDVQVGG